MTHADELRRLVLGNGWFLRVLRSVREVELPEWAVTSGIIRNLVWDHLHGRQRTAPKDVDVAFFDSSDVSRERDARVEQLLGRRRPDVPWEVTNQAGVHLWYEGKFGHPIRPMTSLQDGISRYPETATSIGIRLETDGEITVIAPCGLDDLFGLILRRNPTQVTKAYFRQRLREKRIEDRWPRVTVIDS